MWTREPLARDLKALGVEPGDVLMVHAGLRSIGKMLNGPDTFIAALRDAVGPSGSLMAYTDWNAEYEQVLRPDGSVPDEYRTEVTPFDPLTSSANRENGAFAEFLRRTPGARRSASAGPSCAAGGADAAFLIEDHAIDYGYGPQSPFARLCELNGKVLLAGAPRDTMTLLHHAEHLADVPDKRKKSVEVPFLVNGETSWRRVEEFDTGVPVLEQFADDCFATIVTEALAAGIGREGHIGLAPSVLMPAREIVDFAVRWIETHARTTSD